MRYTSIVLTVILRHLPIYQHYLPVTNYSHICWESSGSRPSCNTFIRSVIYFIQKTYCIRYQDKAELGKTQLKGCHVLFCWPYGHTCIVYIVNTWGIIIMKYMIILTYINRLRYINKSRYINRSKPTDKTLPTYQSKSVNIFIKVYPIV